MQTEIKKTENQDEKNLSKLLAKFADKTISERKESIYKDTKHLKDFDGGKKWRNKQRKNLEKFSIAFISAMKSGNKEKQKETFAKFESFYKEIYHSNSFIVSSVYSGSNENKIEYFTNFFELCKIYKGMK